MAMARIGFGWCVLLALLSGCAASGSLEPNAGAGTLSPATVSLQSSTEKGDAGFFEEFSIGPEVQVYPAGIIAGVLAQTPVSDDDLFTFRIAYNATDRQDFGEQDDEEGGGPGFGVGYRHFFDEDYLGWLVGGRLDLWFLEIDWEDDNPVAEGTTDVIVLQPTIEGGYAFDGGDGWRIEVTASVGAEINVDEDGEDVGEGAIGLLGVSFTKEF